MNRRKLKLDMTHSVSDNDSNEVENHVNNVKEQIMNSTQDNLDYVWQECYDDVSGFIYYWNTQTNKVTWEKPDHYEAHNVENEDVSNKTKNSRKRLSSDSIPTLNPNSCNSSKKSKLESKGISALVAYGSDSSEDENEYEEDQKSTILQRLQQKAEMFKQKELDKVTNVKSPNLCEANGQPDILDIIGKEVPPDYVIEKPSEKKITGDIFDIIKSEVPPDYIDDTTNNNTEEENKLIVPSDSKEQVNLQSKIFENDSKPEYYPMTVENSKSTALDCPKENSLKSFNLIANYGEEEVEDSDDQSNDLTEKSFSYVQDPCANLKTGFGYSVSSKHKNGGSIHFVKGETINLQNNQNSDKNNVQKPPKNPIKNCDTIKAQSHIEDLSLLISSKLHFLSDCENNEKLSSVQVMTIKIDTLLEAWKSNCLNDEYFSKWLDEMAIELSTLEESVAPDGWTCQWDKINTRYYYQNVVDGRTQWQYPTEESECRAPSPPVISKTSTPPPPNISEQNTSHPEPVDMDIEDDSHKEDTEIIVPPVPGDELSYELNSFYADLAQYESKHSGQIETMIAVPTPEIETAPKLNATIDTIKNTSEEEKEKEIVKPKKKKKNGKLDVGLGLKQKYVSSLVQKWQQIQNEIK